jgi:lysozyme
LTPNQFSALVSFVYNVGAGAFEGSTMLALINEGQFGDAALQFARWVDDPPLPGLVERRAAEKSLWLTPG